MIAFVQVCICFIYEQVEVLFSKNLDLDDRLTMGFMVYDVAGSVFMTRIFYLLQLFRLIPTP